MRQTAQYAVAIAQEAGLAEEQIDLIRQAALVHDVGKLGSPASLLQKAEDLLKDDELLAVMRHPIDGAQLLESFPDLKHLAPIVMAHREEYNGEGYPQGLKGDDIPIESRIISIAKNYHTMVSKLKYRDALSQEEAQKFLLEDAGKKFDPTYVQALLQAVKTGKVPAML